MDFEFRVRKSLVLKISSINLQHLHNIFVEAHENVESWNWPQFTVAIELKSQLRRQGWLCYDILENRNEQCCFHANHLDRSNYITRCIIYPEESQLRFQLLFIWRQLTTLSQVIRRTALRSVNENDGSTFHVNTLDGGGASIVEPSKKTLMIWMVVELNA